MRLRTTLATLTLTLALCGSALADTGTLTVTQNYATAPDMATVAVTATVTKDTPACAGDDSYCSWLAMVSAVPPTQACATSAEGAAGLIHYTHGYTTTDFISFPIFGTSPKKLCLIVGDQNPGDDVVATMIVQPDIYPSMGCSSFSYQEDAQAYLNALGDWMLLDTDHDGIACNRVPQLPHRPVAPPPASGTPNTPGRTAVPRLTLDTARHRATIALLTRYRRRYRAGRHKFMTCRRVRRAQIRCRVSWHYAGRRYAGFVWVTKRATGRIVTAVAVHRR